MQAGGTGTRPQIDSVEACRNGKRGMWIWFAKRFSVPSMLEITVNDQVFQSTYVYVCVCECALFSTFHCYEPTLFSVGLSFTRN